MTTSIDPTTPLTYNPVIDALVGSWRQIIDADYSADDTRLPDLAVLARSTARAVAAAVPVRSRRSRPRTRRTSAANSCCWRR